MYVFQGAEQKRLDDAQSFKYSKEIERIENCNC